MHHQSFDTPVTDGDDDHSFASAASGVVYSEVDMSTSHNILEEGPPKPKDNKEAQQLMDITRRESRAVFTLRIVLIISMIISAVIVCIGVYFYLSEEEEETFESQFESDALKLLDDIGTNFDLTMGAADAFMIRVVSQAHSTDAVWPMVTIPDLAVQAAKLIAQTDAIYFTFYPVITGEKRNEWENFTKYNDAWVEEGLDTQERNPNFHGPILRNYSTSSVIWRNEGPETEDNPGPFMPSWMGSPVIPTYYPYNWNALAYPAFAEGLITCVETKTVVMTSVANSISDASDPEAVAQAQTTSDWGQFYLSPEEDSSEPFADFYYPVVDNIDDVVLHPDDSNALGAVAFSFYWRHIIRNILPPNSKGLLLVVENPCGSQQFTYIINGENPTFLGFGDLHETKQHYEEMAVSKKLTDLVNHEGTYTGLPMNADFCPYVITVYPSTTMEEKYVTSDPIVFTIAVASIFLFTSLVFLSYDRFVNRVQHIIKKRALQSGSIVSSLFPDQVKQQLYEENAEKEKKSQFGWSAQSLEQNSTHVVGRPNAQLYLNTTVFMADLVGFTQWSAKRTPIEVFELLEAIYGEFDRLAARRKVFKVETIGDSYVAVTGIPEPQVDHACIMARFARDCLEQLPVVTRRLSSKLGKDTEELGMRVGLHSGNTTAGVLRGEKGRFQLFGDTINTASRMESTGVKSRIQVSQSTADELGLHGKSNWIAPREDKVFAKGKGEMQTYFVVIKGRGTNSSSQTSHDKQDIGASYQSNEVEAVDVSNCSERKRSVSTSQRTNDTLAMSHSDSLRRVETVCEV